MAGTAALPCSPLSVDISRALALANVVLLGAGQDNSGGEEEQGGHRSLEQSSAKLAPWHATIIISLATGDNSLNFRSRADTTTGVTPRPLNDRCISHFLFQDDENSKKDWVVKKKMMMAYKTGIFQTKSICCKHSLHTRLSLCSLKNESLNRKWCMTSTAREMGGRKPRAAVFTMISRSH